MKKTLALCAVLALLILSVQPAWARRCPRLVREGRELLAKSNLAQAEKDKISALINEAEKLHNAGSHDDSVNKANEALGLLKK